MENQEEVVANINVIDVREGADGCRTGKGAGFLTEVDAKTDFEARRVALAVPQGKGDFLLDLVFGDDVVDTIEIDEAGYRTILGEEPMTVAQNVEYDRQYWAGLKQLAEALA